MGEKDRAGLRPVAGEVLKASADNKIQRQHQEKKEKCTPSLDQRANSGLISVNGKPSIEPAQVFYLSSCYVICLTSKCYYLAWYGECKPLLVWYFVVLSLLSFLIFSVWWSCLIFLWLHEMQVLCYLHVPLSFSIFIFNNNMMFCYLWICVTVDLQSNGMPCSACWEIFLPNFK